MKSICCADEKMFPKRSSKNYDSPAEGELQGNYTLVEDSDIVNDDADVHGDVQQLNVSNASCPEGGIVSEPISKQNTGRHSLPADARSVKEKRTSLKKRLSFRLFESKGKKRQSVPKEGQQDSKLLIGKESNHCTGQPDRKSNNDDVDLLDAIAPANESSNSIEEKQPDKSASEKSEHIYNIEENVHTVICNRQSSMLEEILAETGHFEFIPAEHNTTEI